MPTDHGRHTRRQRRRVEAERPDVERLDARRTEVRVDPDQAIGPETAAYLQDTLGNDAIRDLLLDRGTLGRTGELEEGEEQEEIEEVEEIEEQGEMEGDLEAAATAGLPLQGLPDTGGDAGGPSYRSYGGDDDAPPFSLPPRFQGLLLHFHRNYRSNRDRLERLREAGRLALEGEDLLPSDPEGASDPLDPLDERPPPADPDAAIYEAWTDPAWFAGRSLDFDALASLAGSLDPLGRSLAASRFVADRTRSFLGRSLSRLLANDHGAVLAPRGGYPAAAARLGNLTALAVWCEGATRAPIRAHAIRTALDEAAIEHVLDETGPYAEVVPSPATVFGRLTGTARALSAPPGRPHEDTVHWWLPALSRASQMAPLPEMDPLPVPISRPPLDLGDPEQAIDALFRELDPEEPSLDDTPSSEEPADPPSEHAIPHRAAQDRLESLRAAGGRTLVELAAAALAARLPGHDEVFRGILLDAARDFRRTVQSLDAPLSALEPDPTRDPPVPRERVQHAEEALTSAREALEETRQRTLLALAATVERR